MYKELGGSHIKSLLGNLRMQKINKYIQNHVYMQIYAHSLRTIGMKLSAHA